MLLLKATVVLALAPIVANALRRAPASTRHRLWSWTFAGLLALPVLVVTLPPLTLPLPVVTGSSFAPSAPVLTSDLTTATPIPEAITESVATSAALTTTISPKRQLTPMEIVGGLWLAGSLLSLLALVVSIVRVHRLSRSAVLLDDPGWSGAMTSIAQRLALRTSVSIRISPGVATPMAGGFLRPTIFLPSSAVHWDAEQRDVVLAHELAHLAAHDPQRHVLARLALSLYWFHPLAWFAARQATAAREAACDERVLSLGTRPSTYARVLLDLAESMQGPPPALATLPIVHHSSLEVRVMAILNGSVRRSSHMRGVAAVLSISLGTLMVAAAAPRAARPDSPARWVETSPSRPPSVATPAAPPASSEPREISAPSPQPDTRPTAECSAGHRVESFSGSISSSGPNLISERVGILNQVDRVILFTLDGTRLCMFGESVGPAGSTGAPSQWLGRAKRVVIEASTGNTMQRMVVDGGNTQQPLWQVNGVARPIDRAATEWRDRMLAMFDARWELTMAHSEETTLRGQITSIHGQETSLRGQITSLRGQVTSMRGHITTIRGQETTMRGRITTIRSHETTLHGQITTARGIITSLNAPGYRSSDADRRIAEQERRIEQIEREIQDYNADAKIAAIEKEIAAFDAERKIAEVEKQIDDFDVERKIEEIERQIAELNTPAKVREIEREIEQLDVEKRVAEIQRRIEAERPRLKAAIAAIR
jgi:beta-lactamase regulating signal transducer with metallopeptidase domain/predicted  nucleic acid-binding Zn-ribbon protein